MSQSPKRPRLQPDYGTLMGLAVAAAGLLGGLVLERGQLKDVTQFTAALIVVGGTLGAVLVSTPIAEVLKACKRGRVVFWATSPDYEGAIEQILRFASHARREGIVSLEEDAQNLPDPFFRKAMNLVVDGVDTNEIRKMLDLETGIYEEKVERDAKLFEAAGGYSPTIGIIGAVMGLIQVMKHLENITEVGKGIAVAFVATIYGVGLANLVLLPAGSKIRAYGALEVHRRELITEGVLGIAEGLNPKLIHEKLGSFLEDEPRAEKAERGVNRAPVAAARADG